MKQLIPFLLLSFAATAQTNLKVGEPAPPIVVTEWLANTPADTSLAGKYIVLEFWATWCVPCLKAVPHLNELQREFPREDLYFISITDEAPEQARTVFDRVDFHSIVVTDEYGETHRNFGDGSNGLRSYPLTVLIDNRGIVRWYGNPKELTVDKLDRFLTKTYWVAAPLPPVTSSLDSLAEGKTFIPQVITFKDWCDMSEDSTVIWSVNIRQVDGKPADRIVDGAYGPNHGYAVASDLTTIFEYIFPEQKLVLPAGYQNRLYEFSYHDKQPSKDSPDRLRAELFAQLGLRFRVSEEETEAYTFTVKDPNKLVPTREKRFTSIGKDKLGAFAPKKATLTQVAQGLVQFTDSNWTYRGKDRKKYDFLIGLSSPETTIADLESYGLRVKSKPTTIEVVTVLE
ncbi:MAG: TlpA disulfide reductase family protein [Bacteroidota bacterium]